MKRFAVIVLVFACLLLSGCSPLIQISADMVRGSGNITTDIRAVSGFTRVQFTGSGSAQIAKGDAETLKIEADDNILPLLTSEVVNGTLVIGTKPGSSYSASRDVRYTLTVKELTGIETSGSLNVTSSELAPESLSVVTSGSGNIIVAGFQGKSLSAQSSGSGNIDIRGGKTDTLTVTLSGSGQFTSPNLESQSAHVTTTGSGNITVWVKSSLDGSTSGSGNINYYGSPSVVNVNSSGSGKAFSSGAK